MSSRDTYGRENAPGGDTPDPGEREVQRLLEDEVRAQTSTEEERAALLRMWNLAGQAGPTEAMDDARVATMRDALRAAAAAGSSHQRGSGDRPDTARPSRATRRSGGGHRVLGRIGKRPLWLAAAIAIGLAFTVTLLRPVTYQAGDRTATVTLEDGSVVELAAGSRLRGRRVWLGDRHVRLEGEAFFEVTHDANRPFVVETHDGQITVLGTRFAVRGWPASSNLPTAVYLESGSVALESKTDPPVSEVLEPGESREFTSPQEVGPSGYGAAKVDAWRANEFVFFGESLSMVLEEVARRFGVSLTIGSGVDTHQTVSGAFRSPDSAESVVTDLAIYLGVEYRSTSGGFILVDPNMPQ